MDTTRYAAYAKATSKPRPCLPSLQRSRSSRTRVAAPGRARAVSLDEISDRSLSRDDLIWEARMCLEPMKQRSSIDDLGFDEEDAYDEGEVEGSFENNRKGRDDDGEDIFPQDESVKGVEALVLAEAAVVSPSSSTSGPWTRSVAATHTSSARSCEPPRRRATTSSELAFLYIRKIVERSALRESYPHPGNPIRNQS